MNLLKTFAKYATGSVFTLIAGLITTPILTRLISTEEMGKYSMFFTIASLFSSILYLGLDQSYVRFYNEEKESSRVFLLGKCITPSLTITGIIVLIILVNYRYVSQALVGEAAFWVACVFSLYLFALVISRFWLLRIRMEQKAGYYSSLNVVRKLSYLLIAVGLYFTILGDNYSTLIIAVTVAEVFVLLCARWIEHGGWRIEDKTLAVSQRQLYKYGAPFIFSTSITYLFQSTDKLMLNALSTYGEIGLYSGAQNIVHILTQVQMVFTTFWVPVAYEHYAKDREDTNFFIKINKIVSYIMLLVAIVLLCVKDLVVLFLGSKYREAVYVFPFLAFMPIMYTVSETTVMGINFKKKTNYHVIVSVVCVIVNAIGNYFFISSFGARGAAISTGLAYVVFFCVRTYLANKVYPIKFALTRFLVSCLAVYCLAILASFTEVTWWFIAISFAVVLIVTMLYRDVLSECMNVIKKIEIPGVRHH